MDLSLACASLAGPTLYQPRGKERVLSNPIHDLVSIAQRFGGGHAQNVTIRHGSFRACTYRVVLEFSHVTISGGSRSGHFRHMPPPPFWCGHL